MTLKSDIRIACIEDEMVLRANMVEILCGAGYQVRDFADGAEALDYMSGLKGPNAPIPHIILTDINMPQMNGIEFIRRLKNLNAVYRQTPVIMLTALTQEKTRDKAESLDIYQYILKPIDYDQLLIKIQQCLEGSKNEKTGIQ